MHSNDMVREIGRQRFRDNSPLKVYCLHLKSVSLMPCLYAKMSKPWGNLIFTLELLSSNQQLHTEILSHGQQCPGHSEGRHEFRALDPVLELDSFVRLCKVFEFNPILFVKTEVLIFLIYFFDTGNMYMYAHVHMHSTPDG